MDAFKININIYKQDIKDALIDVLGTEYTSLILKRFDDIYFVPYVNHNGAKAYYKFMISCISKAMTYSFLCSIGIDVEKYNITNFADEFPKELELLCENLLGGSLTFENSMQDCPCGCKSFSEYLSKHYPNDYILKNKINFINAVKNESLPTVTEANFEEFLCTEEYKRIEELALHYCEIYGSLVTQANRLMGIFNEYYEFYEKEEIRKRKIYNECLVKIYEFIEDELNDAIKGELEKIDIKAGRAYSLLSYLFEKKYPIEYFSKEDEIRLNNSTVSDEEKAKILKERMSFFRKMNTAVSPNNDNYYELMEREDIKLFIPSFELVEEIINLKKTYMDEAEVRFIIESDTYSDTLAYFGKGDLNKRNVYDILKDNRVCVSSGRDSSGNFRPIIYSTIRDWQCGCMDYVLIHEIIHAIECVSFSDNDYSCGFESEMLNPSFSELEHSERKRKYERFNEVIVDLLSKEVVELLHNRGHYILDERVKTLSDYSNFNTSIIVKELVRPFYEKYRSLIIEARMTGNMSWLTDCVGKENFEELNSVVDYVDVLVEKGLGEKLRKNETDNELVMEYYLQLEKVDRIYHDMAECFCNPKNSVIKRKIK